MKAYVIEESEKGQKVFKAASLKPKNISILNSELSLKILQELAKRPSCAMDIARKLKQHEQKIYYHLRKMEKAGIIKLLKTEERVGAIAKIYSVIAPYFVFKLFDDKEAQNIKVKIRESEFLNPFIKNKKMNCLIVVGSPDPHGKYAAQASDGSTAIDLALFLGTFAEKAKLSYKLDTQLNEKDLKENLILIGGPKANILIDKINKKLPIYFDVKHEFNIVSTRTKNVYTGDDIGIVIKMKSPFCKDKKILVLSGKRFKGTRAAIIAIVKYCKELNDKEEIFAVVRGIDRDSDGMIDDVEFLEKN